MKPENKKWLQDNGYINANGQCEFSDRYTAILSNTSRSGNSLIAPLRAIREFGLIPKKMLSASSYMTFDDYHNPNCITQAMKDLGQEFKKRFDIRYEQVADILSKELLKDEPLNAAGYAWTVPKNGEYPKPEPYLAAIPNHAFMKIMTPLTYIFDNYLDNHVEGDWIKKLASDYTFYNYDYRVYISSETTPEETAIQNQTLLVLLKNGLLNFYNAFLAFFTQSESPKLPVVEEKPTPPIPTPPPLTNRGKLWNEAVSWLGKDASVLDIAPDEFGCSESVSNIIHNVFSSFEGSIISTAALAQCLDADKRFERVTIPLPGCVIVSPRTPAITGHAGISTTAGKIISNNSATGKMEINYNWDSWVNEFKNKRGLRILMWKPLG